MASINFFVMDSKLRNHSVDVHGSATVAHVKLLLASMSLVPAGLVQSLRIKSERCAAAKSAWKGE